MLTSIREGSARKQTPLCAASKSVDAVRLVHIYNSLLEVLHFQPSSSNAIAMRQMKTSFGGSHSQRRCLFANTGPRHRSGAGGFFLEIRHLAELMEANYLAEYVAS